MSKELKKRTMVYSNVKENKKKAEKLKELQDTQINLNDEFIIGLDGLYNENKTLEKNLKKNKNVSKRKLVNKNKIQKDSNNLRYSNGSSSQKINHKNEVNKLINNNDFRKSPNSNDSKKYINNNLKKSVNEKIVKKNMNNRKNEPNKYKSNKKVKKNIIFYFAVVIFISVLIIGFITFLKAPLFNIKKIKISISNNTVLTELKIEELMGLEENQNIFSFKKKNLINQIKCDSYVENVKIKRSLPNNLIVEVEERSVKFQLEKEGKYIYIDKQGYILEHNDVKSECIVITGFSTEDLNLGNRLNSYDLDGLSAVIQIIQEANNNGILHLISSIDIKDKNDYIINFESVNKSTHLGNMKSINDKMTYIKKILDVEKDFEGEIFVNVDLTKGEYPFFREKV